MTKLNYKPNLSTKKIEPTDKVTSSLNALSKQAVINQSLATRSPQNTVVNANISPVQNSGFGRTNM